MTDPRKDESEIFRLCRHLDEPERSETLRRECGDDEALIRRVERLLAADNAPDILLEEAAMDSTAPASADSSKPTIGPYKLREQIGEGGMGTVYIAEQEKPVRRKVALKIIKAGMDTKDVIARFEAERQALALMDHPNIAHVLDAGSTDAGRPYFVMELVSGIPITEYCDQQKLIIRQRLELFIKVCQAIQHAHQKGIIHRDIKPSNVLVTEHDGVPVPKVIDFGVAKAIGQKLTDKTLYTHHLQPVGTLQYMSPEQSRLSGLDIDTRSDVYSLGLLLYELLTGTLPFDRGSFDKASFDEKRRIIAEDEVPQPSKRISTLGQATTVVTASRQTDVEGLARELRGEIDWILNKSLDKDRNRRYESADRLAEDVQNYLSGDIVNARPLSVGYRLSKAWHRNKVAVLLLAGLSIGLVVALSGWYHSIEVSRQQTETLDGIRDFAMLLARSGTPKDLEQAKRISVLSGESEAWFIMLDAQSMYARGEYDAVARLLEESLDRGLEGHLLARKAMLAFSYIITGRSEDHLRLLREIRGQPPSTAIDEIFKGQALVTDSDQWWRHANKAIDRRESLLALHNRAAAAGHYAVETGNLAIAETGFEDVKRVRDVIGDTPDLFAVVMPLHLARISIMRRQGRDVTSVIEESEREIDLFRDQIPVGIGQILLAWYQEMIGSREDSNEAWMEVFKAGGKGWHRYHAATTLYRDRQIAEARTLLSGDESLEQIALASVLSLHVENHPECRKIYMSLSARRENPTFHSGMPLNILLVMGDLEMLEREAKKMLKENSELEPLEQAMLKLFAGELEVDKAKLQISKLSPSHQMMANVAIGRWFLVQPEPQVDEAKIYLQKAVDSAIFRIGDFYWAKRTWTSLNGASMTDEEHFEELRDLARGSRDRYLEEITDLDQRARVVQLLDAHDAADSLIDRVDLPSTSTPPSTPQLVTIGPYKLREQIGEGGMGTVFVAEQEKPVRRKVALKIIKAGMDTKDVIARFEAERQALALMDHPNIARVLDAGSTDAGRPYFVMELVSGIPITAYCDQQKMTIRERIELFIKVCQAIQHAHQKGIIHRDIKPSNVLVTEHDGVPVPKVIDFGVAKAIGQKLTDKTVYTHHLQPVGTLQYMSPEQSRLSGLDVDTRSDVYSLGLLLYEVLTGALPFDRETFNQASFDEKRRIIAEDEVPKPSTRISALDQATTKIAVSRQTDLEKLRRELKGEIDWILKKALDKDRNRRYESADRLAEDLRNHLDGDIVAARPPSFGYRLSKAWKRNKAATLMLGLLFVGILGVGLGWYQSVQREADAERRLNVVQDFAMVLAMRGNDRDTEIAVNFCKASGATEVWSDMLKAQSEMASGNRLSTAIDRLERASRKDDPHRLSCLGLLAFAYILDGGSDRSREIEQTLRNVVPSTPTEKIFFSNAYLSDPEACWALANEAIHERESILARYNRARAATMQAMNANDLEIARIGLEDLSRVREVVQETPEQVANRCQLYLAGQLIVRSDGNPDDASLALAEEWSEAGNMLVSRLAGMSDSPQARIVRAWYLDSLGSDEPARAAWMDVLESGSNGWQNYHAAAILYANNDVSSARKYLQGDNTIERLALAAVLSRGSVDERQECLEIYNDLAPRNSTAMFYGGFPLEILLDLGFLERLKDDASDLLKDGRRRSVFDQLMLSYFADVQDEDQVLDQLKQFNRLNQVQGHTLIGRRMMVSQPPRIDEAIEQFEIARRLGVYNLGDFHWAKAYLKRLSEHGENDLSNDHDQEQPQ